MWKITEILLSNFYGPPGPLYIPREGVKLVVSDDFTHVFVTETDEYVGWIILNFFMFKRKVNEGVTVKGLFGSSEKGYPYRYFPGVSREEVLANIQHYVEQLKGYVKPEKGEVWGHLYKQP